MARSLARLQLRIALEELVRRFDSVKLPEDTELEYEANFLVRGLTRLPLIFESSVN